MTTASTRTVPFVAASFRRSLLASASIGLMLASAQTANAACDGSSDTCTLVIGAAGANQEDITGAGTYDAGAGAPDILAFSGVGMTLNANTIGTGDAFTAPLRFLDFELAQVNAGSDLTLTGTGSATLSLTWTIDGTLNTLGGNAIGDNSAVTVSAIGVLDLGVVSETIGSLNGTGLVNILSPAVLTTGGNGNSTVFTGLIAGAGGLTKVGSGTMELNSDNSFSGPLSVSGGVLEIGHAGAIDQASSVTISNGSTLSGETAYTIIGPVTITTTSPTPTPTRLTGNATINGNVSSNGGLQPGNTSIPPGGTVENPGQDMGAITINGNYTSTGTSAYVGFFIDIDAATAPGLYNPVTQINGTPGTTHDFLTINGDITGTNSTMFSLASFNSAAVGAPTTGNGIQVIRVTGASAATNFYQGSAMNAGPYQYLLKHVANYSGSDDGFFLQSAARDEIVAHAALLSAGQEIVRNCYHDGQRIPDSPKGATYGRAWVGYRQGSTDFGADTGIESNVDFSCTTGGMDWRMGNGWFGGISGGFGDTEGNILTPAGVGSYMGTGRAAEVFASFTSEALFINLSAGYNAMNYTYNGALLFPITADTQGLLATAETGVALDLDAIAVKLIGAVSYDGTSCSDTCLGMAVSEETGLIEAKGTVRIDGVAHGGSVRPWLAASFSEVLSDGINTVSLGAVSVSHDTSGQRLSLDAGLQAYLDQNFALYLDGGYHESLSTDVSGYKAGIGLKMYW